MYSDNVVGQKHGDDNYNHWCSGCDDDSEHNKDVCDKDDDENGNGGDNADKDSDDVNHIICKTWAVNEY